MEVRPLICSGIFGTSPHADHVGPSAEFAGCSAPFGRRPVYNHGSKT